MLVMGALLALYAWGAVSGVTPLNRQIIVPQIPAIAALVTFIVTLIMYFKTSTNRLSQTLFLGYSLTLTTLTTLVVMTDAINSPFFGWLVVALTFAGFFTTAGVIFSLVVIAGLIAYELVIGGKGMSELLVASVTMLLPAIGGYVLWVRIEAGANANTNEDRAYNELASELSELAGKSEVVINAITDGVLALDGRGIIQLINPAAQQILGWTKHDALTLSYKSILKMLDAKNQPVNDANDPVAQAIATNKAIKTDSFSLETQSSKSFLASISVSPVGQLGSGVIIVFRDVTTEKSDERQRAEFISTASHEMRTPVASIEGYLGLALNPATATIDEKARDFINKAHESAQHLGRLFSDLLDVSKADDSRLKNDPEIVDVVPFIHDIVEGLTPKAVEKNLRVLFKPMPSGDETPTARFSPVFYANVDNDHLREIAQNLVENAIKYTPQGDIVVDVTGDNEHIVLSVADTGIGIPREDQVHLFQKFYRVDSSDTREIGGTGLGLYLCRRLTETIGGRIWVESEYKRGSTFFIEIPRIDHDEAMRLIEQSSVLAEQRVINEEKRGAQLLSETPAIAQVATPVAPASPPITPAPAVLTPQVQPQMSAPTLIVPTPTALPAPSTAPEIVQQPTVVPAPQLINTPISAIEADPNRYVSRPQALDIVVPPREPGQ